ncbi:MAG: NAD(+)/NADH kinase [Acidimicrobiia bacterium]
MTITSAVLVVHHERAEAAALAAAAADILRDRAIRVVLPHGDARAAGLDNLCASDDECRSVDLAVSLGGDGTMLRTVDLVSPVDVPVLGVNVGMLGYLTEVEPAMLTESLESVLAGTHRIEERMMLDVRVLRSGAPERQAVCLNEMVIEKREAGHTVRLLPSINGSPFTPYAADGLIVSTPTGSTAYALSARGPILSPTIRALLMTPVSPHMLFDRSLVLGADESISIELGLHRPASVSIDGRHLADLVPGDRVICTASMQVARLVRFGHSDFHQRLKAKFQLADR